MLKIYYKHIKESMYNIYKKIILTISKLLPALKIDRARVLAEAIVCAISLPRKLC